MIKINAMNELGIIPNSTSRNACTRCATLFGCWFFDPYFSRMECAEHLPALENFSRVEEGHTHFGVPVDTVAVLSIVRQVFVLLRRVTWTVLDIRYQ